MPRKDTIHDAVKTRSSKTKFYQRMRELHRLPLLIARVSSEEVAEWIE